MRIITCFNQVAVFFSYWRENWEVVMQTHRAHCLESLPQRTVGRGPGRLRRRGVVLLCSMLMVMAAQGAQAAGVAFATLTVENQALDFDTATVLDARPAELDVQAGADVRLAYNADRTPHAVVVPALEGVELAFLDNVVFDGVSPADIAGLSFSVQFVDLPLGMTDTVVVRTDSGAVFKLGNAVEGDLSVSFNYAQLQ